MNLQGKRILITGAAGGLGQELALQLASQGAILALLDRNAEKSTLLCSKINQNGGQAISIINDFSAEDASDVVINEAIKQLGNIDILINSAGVLDFTAFATQNQARITQIMYVNAIVPMQLARVLLPKFLERNTGHIVNIGSIFGSIGFPHYASYSASKFALRGFSQALRRELFDSKIKVTYIAPRAIKTPINNQASSQMMEATKTTMDDAVFVAKEIITAIIQQKDEHYIGQPESFFARLNGIFPSLVSNGLKKPTQIARRFLNAD
jgi:short-subunit dehydrogenase